MDKVVQLGKNLNFMCDFLDPCAFVKIGNGKQNTHAESREKVKNIVP